jgi:hypothetical protein
VGRHDHVHGRDEHVAADAEMQAVVVDSTMEGLVSRLLKRHGHPPSRAEMAEAGMQRMDAATAARSLDGKLPAEVASLVRLSVAAQGTEGAASRQPFSEDSLAKGRKYLNVLIEKAWAELDVKLIDCKEFEDRNRGTFDQVMTDIARLAEQIADLERIKSEATEMINVKEQEMDVVVESLKKATSVYMKIYMTNKQQMTIRKNDLAVFQFMLQLVKCKKTALVQVDRRHHRKPKARICQSSGGELVLDFSDEKAQTQLMRLMTPTARQAISEVLAGVEAEQAEHAAALLQHATRRSLQNDDDYEDDRSETSDGEEDADEDQYEDSEAGDARQEEVGAQHQAALVSLGVRVAQAQDATTTTTPSAPTLPVPKTEVQTDVPVEQGQFKCPVGPPDCGLLHDKMSLMWGKFKDLVDELQAEMDKNEAEFEMLKVNYNSQLGILKNTKAKFIQQLSEATANLNSDREEMKEKEQMRTKLEGEYKAYMSKCKKRLEWIMYQDICAYLKVRATLMTFSSVSPPEKISDCGVSAWVPSECSVSCDDSCPDPTNPLKCGGVQVLSRTIVVNPNEFGLKCPELTMKRICNQIKCPVNCVMSAWSRFSKCTKACEGGVRGRTRSILTKPRNGGMSCNTNTEQEPCNTGSCDRDCRLKKWSSWTPSPSPVAAGSRRGSGV